MHRTFIALPVSSELRLVLRKLQERLISHFPDGGFRFLDLQDAHLTISFLGDQTDEEVGQTAAALASVAPMLALPSEIYFNKVVYLPQSEDPSMIALVADDASSEALSEVRDDLENGLLAHEVKFRPDNRRFVAHITLARRTKESVLLPELQESITASLVPEAIHFYEAHTGKEGSRYELLMSTPVEGEV